MIDLTAKVALITGSSRGIGRACAIEMARAGADICVNYRSHPAAAEDVAAEIGVSASFSDMCFLEPNGNIIQVLKDEKTAQTDISDIV